MQPTTLKDRLLMLLADMPRGSQAALARACKIKGPSVNNWLSGRTKTIEGENLLNAARFFDVNPDWLATGRGPRERFRITSVNAEQQLGETVTNGLASQSQPLTLTPESIEFLHEALMLLAHDESQAGEYTPRDKTLRLAALYARVTQDGGRLSKKHNAEFVEEIMARRQGAERGKDRGLRRGVKGRR